MQHKSRNSGREPLSAGTGLPALMMADRKGGAMDYLSVKEAAALKGCSVQSLQKQCKNGVLPAVLREHPQNHKPCYQIPHSSGRRSRSGQQFCWNGTPDASSTAGKPTMTSCMWASVSWSTQTYRFPRGSCTANGTPIRSMISPVCWGYGEAGTSTAAVFPRLCGRRFCGSG